MPVTERLLRWLLTLLVMAYVLLVGFLLVENHDLQLYAGDPLRIDLAEVELSQAQTLRVRLEGTGLHDGLQGVVVQESLREQVRVEQFLAGQYLRNLAMRDDLLVLLGKQARLIVARQDADGELHPLGSMKLPVATAADVELLDHYALIGLGRRGGVLLVDLSRPDSPTKVQHILSDSVIQDLEVIGEQVYYVDLYAGIYRIDLREPQPVPIFVTEVKSPWRLACQGDRLAVGSLEGRLMLFEAAETGELAQTAAIELDAEVMDLQFMRDHLVVALKNGSLQAWDLSAWPVARQTGTLSLPGRPLSLQPDLDSSQLVVSLLSSGLARVRIDAAGTLQLAGRGLWAETYQNLQVRAGRVYAVGSDGLEVFDLEQLAAPGADGVQFLHRDHQQLVTWRDRVYGYQDHRLTLFSMPAAPAAEPGGVLAMAGEQVVDLFRWTPEGAGELLASLPMAGTVHDALLHENRLYALVDNQLVVFDAAEPARPVRLGVTLMPGIPETLSPLGSDHVVISAKSAGLLVVDVRDPANPGLTAQHLPPAHLGKYHFTLDHLLVGAYAYVAVALGGVELVDLSRPETPRSLGFIDTPGHASKLARSEDLLLVADGAKGGFLIDIRNPATPVPVGSMPLPIRPREIAVNSSGLVVSGLHGGVCRVPLPHLIDRLPSNGTDRAWLDLAGMGESTAPLRVFVYDGEQAASSRVAVARP